MDYKPGDILNGHVLGTDGKWYPIHDLDSMRNSNPGRRYWSRYAHRWAKTGLVMAIIGPLSLYATFEMQRDVLPYPPTLENYVFGALIGFLLWGTLINFVVAMVPERIQRERPISTGPGGNRGQTAETPPRDYSRNPNFSARENGATGEDQRWRALPKQPRRIGLISLILAGVAALLVVGGIGGVMIATQSNDYTNSDTTGYSSDSEDAESADAKDDDDTAATINDSGFGDYSCEYQGAILTFHLADKSYSNDLIDRTNNALAKHTDYTDVHWIKAEIDNTDGSETMGRHYLYLDYLTTNEGERIANSVAPILPISKVETKAGRAITNEWWNIRDEFPPGTKGHVFIMMHAPVTSVKDISLDTGWCALTKK